MPCFVIANDSGIPQDPNHIPVSPSGSALRRLSAYEKAPSVATSESRTASPPRAPSTSVPPMDSLPDIPDLHSKSSKQLAPSVQQGKQSKLSKLASTRASTHSKSTTSSRTSAADSSSSVTTYPALRPTSKSIRPISSSSVTSTSTSTSSLVRRAVQTAIDLEAEDQIPTETRSSSVPAPAEESLDSKSMTPRSASSALPVQESPPPTPSGSHSSSRQPSKLALMARAKAQTYQNALAPRSSKAPALPSSPGTVLPPPTTEYLTPIANGPTATTAITTSWQSLYSLTSPSSPLMTTTAPFSSVTGHVVPHSTLIEPKPSKLAMKMKKKHEIVGSAIEDVPVSTSALQLFVPEANQARALPSAFASLLIDDSELNPEDNRARRSKEKKTKMIGDTKTLVKGHGKPKKRHPHRPPATTDLLISGGFAFDAPSPDDVVIQARRGTSLAKNASISASMPSNPLPSSPSRS
jgi:hypothetical protein